MNPSILPVIGYTLESKTRSPIDLKYYATYTIKPFLSQVDGVSEVRIIGGKNKEYWISLDPRKMSTLSITPDEIATGLSQTNFVTSNGYLTDYRYMYLALTDALVDSKDKLENIVVKNDGKRITLVKDIADVSIQEAKEYVKINANGKEGILIAVIKQPNANLLDMSDQMQQKLAELRKTLPKDITIEPYYMQSDFVRDSVRECF